MLYSRFKQIKEQEARRRQQREEEKRRAEEAAANATQVTNDRREIENGKEVELVVERSKVHQSEDTISNSSNGVSVNGLPRQEVKEDSNTTSGHQTADSEVSPQSEVDAQQSNENLEKVTLKYMLMHTRTNLN